MEQKDLFDFAFDGEEKEEVENVSEDVVANSVLSYEDFDYNKLNTYGSLDCIATIELLRKQLPVVTSQEPILLEKGKKALAPPIIDAFHSIVIPSQEFLIDLEINGMKYSVPRNAWLSNKMESHIAQLDEKIFTAIGRRVDLNSGARVAEFLYGEKGFTAPGVTKGGEPATDGQALMKLAGLDPVGGKYVTKDPSLQWLADMAVRRDVSSVHNTFVKTYVKDFVKRDGRIHGNYNQFGTSSYRITGSDPNFTQLPRNKHGYNVRSCYIVDEGNVFISFDFSSAEVKVLSAICRDPAMLKAVREGLDFHTFSASSMHKIAYEEMMGVLKDSSNPKYKEYKEKRQVCKILTFSIDIGTYVW